MSTAAAYVRESGSGDALVCIHSSGSSSGQWRALMESMSDRYRVLAPDLYGCGKSPAWPGDRELLLDDEIALLASALHSAEQIHLVGHSYGGLIALRFASRNPGRVASLVVYEPTCFFVLADKPGFEAASREIRDVREETSRLVEAGDLEGSARRFLDYWVGPDAWSKTPEAGRATIAKVMQKVAFEWPNAFENAFPSDELRALTMPTLLLTGSGSTLAARSVIRVLRAYLPHAASVEIPDLGHMGPVTHPQPVNRAIAAFLDGIRR